MTLVRIAQVALTVRDIEQGIVFYRDALGLTFLFRTPTMAFFDCGGTRILIGTENATAQAGAFLYFAVDDITAAHKELVDAGVSFDEPPHMVAKLPDREVWLAVFRDPAGTIHHLMSEPSTQA
jgi:methylmalonyl-CoA/ethylmalonyl-CoA epimerase